MDTTVSDGVQAAPESGGLGLARGVIGLPEVIFQSVTNMAPALAVAFSIAVGAAYAGGALALSVLLALVACLTVAISMGQLSQHLPSAGAVYTFPARGIHPWVGFLCGWGYGLVEAFITPFGALIFGSQIAGQLTSGSGTAYTVTWLAFAVVLAVCIFLLSYFGIRFSARTGIVLGLIEITVFFLLAVWLIVKAGSSNTAATFTLHYATVKGFSGFSGVIAGAVYTILAFVGFEAAAPLAEETRNPRRNIKVATIYSCLVIGLFYVFTTYAATVFFGPTKFVNFSSFGGGSPWVALAHRVWGAAWILAFLAVLNSDAASCNAATNAVTRTWFAMGRIRLLPSIFQQVNPRWRSPHYAALLQFALTLILSIWLGLQYGPINGFVLMATILTAVMVTVYMLFNLSSLLFYLRERRHEFNWLLHGVIPVFGTLVMIPVLFTSLGIGSQIFSFVSPLPYPISLTGPIVAVWLGIGIIYLIYLARRHPERLRDTGRVFVEESAAVAPESKLM